MAVQPFGRSSLATGRRKIMNKHEFEPAFGFAANLCGVMTNGKPCAQIADHVTHSKPHEIRFARLEMVDDQLVETDVRSIKKSDIRKCPNYILVAEHYRENGSCKCDDPAERARMIAEWGYSEVDIIPKFPEEENKS